MALSTALQSNLSSSFLPGRSQVHIKPIPSDSLFVASRPVSAMALQELVEKKESVVKRKYQDPPIRRRSAGAAAVAAAAAVGMYPFRTQEAKAITCELAETPTGIAFCDIKEGTGSQAEKGMLIKAHYTGRLTDGKVFDSSYNRGRPLVFRVGVNEVIQGWDLGILGTAEVPPMLAGGKRILKLPPNLAYGDRGAGCRGASCVIPPRSTLIFEVEFLGKA